MALVDYFLKIDGIQGESPDAKHPNEIEIETWSWGESNTGTAAHGGGMGAGKVQMGDFRFVMRFNKSSPKLFLACAQGEHIKSAILTCRKAGKEQQEYLKVTFSDLFVAQFNNQGEAGGGALPYNEISLNFIKVEMEYREQKTDGSLAGAVKAHYNIKQQKGG